MSCPASLGVAPRRALPAMPFLWLLSAASSAASLPFINELHYDNAGADQGEGVELIALAGTDLAQWQLVLYNGSDGRPYDTIDLFGTVPAQQEGIGALFFAIEGLQNGPDGLALVSPDASVSQFISYEGSFQATAGPAQDLVSLALPVVEGGDTALGTSLQLVGRGRVAEDFRWIAGAQSTYGSLNEGQEIAAVPLGPSLPLLGAACCTLVGLRGRRAPAQHRRARKGAPKGRAAG